MKPSEHLLLYTDGAEGNGVAEYNHAVLCALAERGYRLTCVQTRKDNPLIRRQAELGVRHVWLDFDTDQDFRRSLTNTADARRIFQEHRPDLVLFSNGCPLSHLAAKRAALELGLPFVIVEGFAALYVAQRFGGLIGELARQYTRARAVVAVSQENLRLLHQRFGLPVGKGTVIYYGRPERFFQPPDPEVRRQLRAEWGIPADAVLCLTAARLDPIKGYPYQLEALRRLRAMSLWPRLYFAWAGTRLLADSLPAVLRQLGGAEQVKLLGQRWDVADWLDAADIYVHPSEAEGMPLAVMEAMAKGLPVIATAVGGIPEELGDTGRLLPPPTDPAATAQALAEAITGWAEDSDGRRAAGAAGRQRAQALFREERMLAETLSLIERVFRSEPNSVSARVEVVPSKPAARSEPSMNPNHASAASVPRVSYAQNQEDILLDRLFRGQTATYVEVGAHHPVQDSNTYFFYQRGWSGVTCEPLPHLHGLLRAHRPNDLHLAVAVSDHDGDLPFYQVPQCDGLSTLSEAVAERHRRQGLQVVQTQVPVRTLARLIAQYRLEVPELLVIDVEGHEREVLAGVPWASWRPKVLVVEATLPLSGEPSHAAWEPLLLEQGYLLDNFTHAETVFLREHIEHLERRLRQLEAQASPRPEAATTALR